jgi:hypothetical protein
MRAPSSPAQASLYQGWLDFFSSRQDNLPSDELESIAKEAIQDIQVFAPTSPPPELLKFAEVAASRDNLLSIAHHNKRGEFPSIYGQQVGLIMGCKLIYNWNLLYVQEGCRRIVVFQGVSCCDAVLIPGDRILLIVCHIDISMVQRCIASICRRSDPFSEYCKPRKFGGYLVGHSRPYHCLYDSMIGFQAVRSAGLFDESDVFISRKGESFFEINSCLDLDHEYRLEDPEVINRHCDATKTYVLYLGFWVQDAVENSTNRLLAEHLDRQLVTAARRHSELNRSRGLKKLIRSRPLIWVGITGQKRSWIDQIDGIANILNQLHKVYPSMGVVFDGWTSPLEPDLYHKTESRNDDQIIQSICAKLTFKAKNRIGILSGRQLLDKIRVGLEVDAFISNYTTGSMNIARICKRPGVGHMSLRMMDSRGPHIHHHTVEVDPQWITDELADDKPTGYISYSIPWQVIYNALIQVMPSSEKLLRSKPLRPLPLPPYS